MTSEQWLRPLMRSLVVVAVALGLGAALRSLRQSCAHREADLKLDERLEESFPASDPVAKY